MEKCPITGALCPYAKIIKATSISDGVETTCNLCQICGANKQPPAPQSSPSIVNYLFSLISLILTSKPPSVQPPPTKQPCPTCGITIEEIAKTSRLGCLDCYEYYKTELMPILLHMHKSAVHVGKQPKNKTKSLPLQEQINLLELQIRQAVEQEQYEKAKELKDRIIILKASLQLAPSSE